MSAMFGGVSSLIGRFALLQAAFHILESNMWWGLKQIVQASILVPCTGIKGDMCKGTCHTAGAGADEAADGGQQHGGQPFLPAG